MLLIVLVIGLSLVFQVQMKLFGTAFASSFTKAGGWISMALAILEVSLTWRGLLIVLLAGAQFVVWLMVLARLDLSLAVPMLSLGLLVVAMSGGWWLGEDLNWIRVVGLVATAVGIGLVTYS
jgi:multidrug transporter EmrE-like cation transporter